VVNECNGDISTVIFGWTLFLLLSEGDFSMEKFNKQHGLSERPMGRGGTILAQIQKAIATRDRLFSHLPN
jgi:hypothetical protein